MVGMISVSFPMPVLDNLLDSPMPPDFHHCLAKCRRMPGKRNSTGSEAAVICSASQERGCSLVVGRRPIFPVFTRIRGTDQFAEQGSDRDLLRSIIQPR